MNTNQQLIDNWLQKNGGARRFDKGFRADPDYIRSYLEKWGFQVRAKAGMYYVSSGKRGAPHRCRWKGLVEFVDELRIKEGKEPIIARQAGH